MTHPSTIANLQAKPRLVFFQVKYDNNIPEFLLEHPKQHIKCLSEFFDVTVINSDCDYQQVCDVYHPDIALFESGINIPTCRRPEITNTHTNLEVVKLGFINADAWCETSSGMLSEMDHWGIETLFSICTTAAEHAPEIADRLFVWPNFIDPSIYKDYGESKLIPALLTGATTSQYPWRKGVYQLIGEHYPSLRCQHQGYLSRSKAGQVISGEHYARTINASWVVPVCGTTAKEIVRKHFEIPGCRTCMITERSSALEAAGFIDMKNCVFANEHDVLDKLDYLFQHSTELQAIADAGYDLVHSKHTLKSRNQIFQWFSLSKALTIHQKIVQTSPFSPLTIVKASANAHTQPSQVITNALHLKLLREGNEKLSTCHYDEAEVLYRKCLSYMPRLPEAKLRLAICSLYQGNAKMARHWTFESLQYTLAEYRSIDPDPIDWAYYIISLICLGKLTQAARRARQFPWLFHPELEKVRWMVKILRSKGRTVSSQPARASRSRPSVSHLPNQGLREWCGQICDMLRACNQNNFATLIDHASLEQFDILSLTLEEEYATIHGPYILPEISPYNYVVPARGLSLQQKRRYALGSFNNQLLIYKTRRRLKKLTCNVLEYIEGKFMPRLRTQTDLNSKQ